LLLEASVKAEARKEIEGPYSFKTFLKLASKIDKHRETWENGGRAAQNDFSPGSMWFANAGLTKKIKIVNTVFFFLLL